MNRLLVQLFFALAWWPLAGAGQGTITSAEYYFDVDPGPGNGTPITIDTPGSNVSVTVNVPAPTIAALNPGINILVVRVADAEGDWSHAATTSFFQVFLKPSGQFAPSCGRRILLQRGPWAGKWHPSPNDARKRPSDPCGNPTLHDRGP